MLEHGGNLREAAREYDLPLSQWIDLSTGINPNGWPVPTLEPDCWRRLPELDDGLEQAAAGYYGSDSLLPVAGSQAAIQALPLLRSPARVGVLSPGYGEHSHGWRKAGHQVLAVAADDIDTMLPRLDHLVLINPNNPTGRRFDPEQLLQWCDSLSERGGLLLVDEAFMDADGDNSLVTETPRPGLVVLRSLGKFFGLAGLRVGFVFAEQGLLDALREQLGPWSVSAPAREVARKALADREWQSENRQRLQGMSRRLADLLTAVGLEPSGGTELFQWVEHRQAISLQHRLARQAVWVRRFDSPPSLRFGLPGDEAQWQRLSGALECLDV